MRRIPRRVKLSILAFLIFAFVLCVPSIGFRLTTSSAITDVAHAPKREVGVVLGAGLSRSGKPGLILDARVKTAVALYKAKKVTKLI